jgi:hypothetical protein
MKRTPRRAGRGLLDGARVYLSGPMDFVADREYEMKYGWRSRVGTILRSMGCVVFDPWQKPEVRGLHEYGREGVDTAKVREHWTFREGAAGARARARLTGRFWETLHIDLRMVDTSDFVVAYCPTNVYSVGTPHEIALARLQRKPVLFVSPPVEFPAYDALKAHLANDRRGRELLKQLAVQLPIKPNEAGIPSLWYMPLVGGENFFDGFGFTGRHRNRHGWPAGPLDERERKRKPARPLLPFLESLARSLPKKWDYRLNRFVRNDDWLLWDLQRDDRGAEITAPKASR